MLQAYAALAWDLGQFDHCTQSSANQDHAASHCADLLLLF